MKKRWLLLPLCLLLAQLPATALAAQGSGGTGQLNFLLYASVASAQTAHSLADALLQRATSWEDLVPRPDPGQTCPSQAAALLARLNTARADRGLSPLNHSESLSAQAMERAEAYTHTLAWLRSPENRANLFSQADTQAGAGCFMQNGQYCWVLLLGSGTKSHVLLPPGDPCRGLAGGPVPSRGE